MTLPDLDFTPPLCPLTDKAFNHALAQLETFGASLDMDDPESDERMRTMLQGIGLPPLAVARAFVRILPLLGHDGPVSEVDPAQLILFTGGYQYGLILSRLATEYQETSE